MSNDEEVIERSPEGRYVRYAQKVGTGSFKTVWKGQDMDTAREVAWNTINIAHYKAALRKRIMEEVMLLRRLSHPCLLQFYGSWLLPDSMQVVFVTELFHAGTLKEFTRKYPISMAQVKKYCRSILECLVYLHTQDPPVIHRDLKCDNIFIDGADGNIKIGDLGLSTQLLPNSEKAYTVLGTPEFMAPEMYEAEYTETVDIYAFGMCVLEMITKRAPYEECANNVAAVMKAVTSGQLPLGLDELKEKWPDAYEFVHRCIVAGEHDSRPSATSLLDDDFLRIRSEDKTRPTAMVPLLEESKDGKGSDHPGVAHGAQGDAAGSVVSSVASGSNSAAAGAPGSSNDVGNRATADPASGGEVGSAQPLRRGEGSLSTIVAARQSDGTVVLAAVDRGESGTLDVSVVGEFAPPEIHRPAIALPDDAGPRSSTPSDGGLGVVPSADACGVSTVASHASSSPPSNVSDSAAHMRASTDRPSMVAVQNSVAGSRANAVPGTEALLDGDSTAPAPASIAIPSVRSTVTSAPASLPQSGTTVPDTSAPVLQAPDALANEEASTTCSSVSPVSAQADAPVPAPGTTPMEPVRLAATAGVAANCDPGSAAEPITSPLPRSSGSKSLACNDEAVSAPERGTKQPPGPAVPPITPSLEDLHRFCARMPALESALHELLRRQAYLAAQQEALAAAVQDVSRAVASLASQQVRAPEGGSARSPRPVDGVNTQGAQQSSPLLQKWPTPSATVPSSSPLSAHGASSSREGAHVAPRETRSTGHHHRSPGHLVAQLDVNSGTDGGHGDPGSGTTAVAAPAYLNELDGLAHAPPLSLREGMAIIGSEESQAYYGDLNRVRQDASRKLHKLEKLHEKNMKSLSEELERERAKLVPEQRRLLQKKQRMHRLQKSLETAAAEAGASVEAGDGSLSAETKKKHQKQNIERRVRLLEQTVDSAKEEYERFRHELSAKTRTVDGEFKARCATVKSSFTANVRKIKLAFNHHVARVITSNQALNVGVAPAGGQRAASAAGPGTSEEGGLFVRPADRHDETAADSLHVGVSSLAETGLSGVDSGGTAARTASPPGAVPFSGDRGDEPPTHDSSSWLGDTGLRSTTGVEGLTSDPSSRVVPPRSNAAPPTREGGEASRIPPTVSVPFGDQPSDALLSTGGTSSDDDRGFRDAPGDGTSLLPMPPS